MDAPNKSQSLRVPGSPQYEFGTPFLAWLQCAGVGVVVLFAGAIAAGDKAAIEAALPQQDNEINLKLVGNPPDFSWVSHGRSVRAHELNTCLRKKIEIIDRVCDLTEAQNAKLQLAGRGDNKRLLDRIDDLGAKIQIAKNDPKQLNGLVKDSELLRLSELGVTAGDSLFAKVLNGILTADQSARYEPLRAVARARGLVSIRAGGLDVVLTAAADDDLTHLGDLPGLQLLGLSFTKVTDRGLKHLKHLISLQVLSLADTRVTDAGLANLSELTKLKILFLECTQVTDSGLEHLKGLTNLECLVLFDTRVTDAGLVYLEGMSKMRTLHVGRTNVTDAGIADLQRKLPGLMVDK